VTDLTAIDEIVASRNRLVDQRQRATDTLSLTLRTIGMGLAAIAYSFVFGSSQNNALAAHKVPLFIAAALGAVSILFDLLQSFADRNSAQGTLEFLKACRNPEYRPTPKEIEDEKNACGGRLVTGFLVLRFLLCMFGILFLMLAICRSL
jgi:hypothetical protein